MPKFSPEYLDELKSRLRPSDVVGRFIKLQKRGANWWGLSPFNKEKTPSFTVNDERRSYHCYSSDNHGDIIKFLQETQGLSFVEAVTRLAEEAGMEIPADDPKAADQAKVRKGLAEACEAAASFFQGMLRKREGANASDYLKRRGVTDEQIAHFRIGYAPGHRAGLKDYLINKGFSEKALIDAGLAIKPEDGGASFDRFRDRVMFPIIGAGGKTIAFGGRALDPNARAKYLNSPETPIFHKSDVLYNFEATRPLCAKRDMPVVVCEGYMDVIALWGAGIKSAVAPLGTALTERQISLLWRLHDEPVMCLDGDAAGVKAAYRAVDRALPLLQPGKSLSFVFLPDGQDPDDIVQESGAAAFNDRLKEAAPLVDVLWKRELAQKELSTPERRAAFRARLRELVRQITDRDVKAAYGAEIVARLRQDQGGGEGKPTERSGGRHQANPWRGPKRRFRSEHDRLLSESRPSAPPRAMAGPRGLSAAREATLALCCIRRPALLEKYEDEVYSLKFENSELDQLINDLIGLILTDPTLDTDGVKGHLQNSPASETLARLLNDEWLNRQSFLRPEALFEEVEAGWRDALRRHRIATAAEQDLHDSASSMFTTGDDVWRAAANARRALAEGSIDDDDGHGNEDGGGSELLKRLDRARARFQ